MPVGNKSVLSKDSDAESERDDLILLSEAYQRNGIGLT